MMCLSDATGSMSGIWNGTKNHIQEMLRRVAEIGGSNMDLMWVAYRDYSDGAGLLEKSPWSNDASVLKTFVESIHCYGGGDYPEAVEEALKFARQEHEKTGITR